MMMEDSVSVYRIFDFSDFDVSSSYGESAEMKFIQNLNGNGESEMKDAKYF
jgi:hypothetical protein